MLAMLGVAGSGKMNSEWSLPDGEAEGPPMAINSVGEKSGWRALVIWECEIKNERQLALRLRRFLGLVG
jgi:hypothetical protein